MPSIFVTVGTTKFSKLINTILSEVFLDNLLQLGYDSIVAQVGESSIERNLDDLNFPSLKVYKYKPSLLEDIKFADLVISHAGAGSIIEALSCDKNLIVVVNDDLMHNHQLEIAEKLASKNYLLFCYCNNLVDTIEKVNHHNFRPFKGGNPKLFGNFLSEVLK